MKESRYNKSLSLYAIKEDIPDHFGMTCVKFQTKALFIPYNKKQPTNINGLLYIEYFDGESGYIRIDYHKEGLAYDATIIELVGDNIWKSVVYSFEGSMYQDGIHLYQSSTEGTTADQALYLTRVGFEYEDLVMSWQDDTSPNLSKITYSQYLQDRPGPKNILALASTTLTSEMRQGMVCKGVTNGTTDPLYFRVNETGDSLYWRADSTKNVSVKLTYYDEGTEDILISFYGESEEDTQSITRTNTLTWKTEYIITGTEPGRVQGDIYITSLESDDPGDAIVDRGTHQLTITTPSGTPVHSTDEFHVGNSTISIPSGTHVLSIAPNDVFDISTGPFTLMCWVKFNDTPSHYDWICNGDSSNDGWKLKGKYSDPYFAGFDDGTHEEILDTNMQFDYWHHLAITSDGTSTYGFYQGVHEWTRSGYTTVNYDPTYGITIGASSGSYSSPMDGYIDEIYFNKGEAKYLPADSPFTPIHRLSDEEDYMIIGGAPMRFQNGYSSQNADVKLSTTGNSSLYVTSVELVSVDTNAKAYWVS